MILGIDEVGRGAWAGPLVVGACVLNGAEIPDLTDSKKLTKKQREKLANEISKSPAIVGLGWVESFEIDELGLSESLKLATRRAVKEIQKKSPNIKITEVIIDGTVNFLKNTPLENRVTLLKKADLLIPAVSAAAISAKVERDNFMSDLAKNPEFSAFCFDSNSGYGTAKHQKALKEYGVSEVHRRSFKPIAELLGAENADSKIEKIQNTTKNIGDFAENVVAEFLQNEKNHKIIARNWRTKYCEIDIISTKNEDEIFFTEVKYRKNADFGGGESALSTQKIKQLHFAAEMFLHKNPEFSNLKPQILGVVCEGEKFEIKEIFENL